MSKAIYKTINYDLKNDSKNDSKNKEHQSLEEKDKIILNKLNMTENVYSYNNTTDPKVWGPYMWFTLHTFSANYPINGGSELVKEQFRNYIRSIPFIIPCRDCSIHASSFIESVELVDKNLEKALSSRKNLFEFFVDFHNQVNKRHNKPLMSYKEAYDMYFNVNRVNLLKYNFN